MFDTIIIGSGPAGLSAALTLKQLNKNILWLGKKDLSFKINSAEKIRNYPGLIEVSGKEMRDVFLEQIKRMNLEIVDKQVTGVYPQTGKISVLCGSEAFEAKTIILAVGVETVKPIAGELENVGQGVSYCATCDGFLYKDKEIAIYSESKEYDHEVEYLANLASKVYFFHNYKDSNVKGDNVIFVDDKMEEIKPGLKQKTIVTKKGEEIKVNGVFILKSSYSPSVLVPGIEEEENHIKVNRKMETNMQGLFAAGDCTGKPYQYTKAVGEGNVAAHSVVEYLALHK
jgi:thioredoxin reductase (NADPH)